MSVGPGWHTAVVNGLAVVNRLGVEDRLGVAILAWCVNGLDGERACLMPFS